MATGHASRAISPYPWDSLPRITARNAAIGRNTRRALRKAFDVSELSNALAEVLAANVKVTVRDLSPSAPPPLAERSVRVATADASLTLLLEPEAALASMLLSRILERPFRLVDAEAPLQESVRGALTALAVEVARRAKGASELVAAPALPTAEGVGIRATISIDDRPYGVSVWAAATLGRNAASDDATVLGALDDTPLTVSLVVAESTATGREISELVPGDIWMPGQGWFADHEGGGRSLRDGRSALQNAVLAAPSSERGIAVGHSEDGRIVVVGTVVALAMDSPLSQRSGDDSKMGGQEEDLNRVVLDSPVVVRVEVGTITLTAREWAGVQPGDVLETGLRLGEPVILRIAGREVARGELVSIDGELGVKVGELVSPGRSP